MKNLKQVALGLVAGAMAIGFSSFTNASNRQTTTYTHNTAQAWNSSSLDQTAANYTPTTSGSGCNSSTNICTYVKSGSTFVQNTEGTYHP